MARNESGVYSLPSGYLAVDGQTIQSSQHNTPLEDLANEANQARPISAGGTGAATAEGARTALGVVASGAIGAELVTPTDGAEDSLSDHLASALLRGLQTPEMHGDDVQAAFDAGATLIDATYDVAGLLRLKSGMRTIFSPKGWLRQTAASGFGAFVSNVGIGDDTIDGFDGDLRIDQTAFPAGVEFELAGATTTTLTLPAGASAVDDAYNGQRVEIRDGAQAGANGTVSDYVGSTRTITLTTALGTAPDIGDTVKIGYNDNAVGFASGASNIDLRRVVVIGPGRESDRFTPAIGGGKAVNFEAGVTRASVQHVHGKALSHSVLFVQGKAGAVATEIVANLVTGEDCGALLTVLGADNTTDPTVDPSILNVSIGRMVGVNVGKMPLRRIKADGDKEKSGIVNLGEAQSVTIGRIFTRNATSLTASWPAVDLPLVGSGLTGPVGAALWGWGPNIKIGMHEHHGDLDAIVHVGRARAAGEDAGPLGHVFNCTSWNVTFDIHGDVALAIDLDNGPANQIPDSELTGYMRATVDAATAFVDDKADGVTGFVLDISERATGKRIIGSLAAIYARGVTFADYPAGLTDLRVRDRRSFTLNDDTAASFTPLVAHGLLRFTSPSSNLSGVVAYRVGASPQCRLLDTVTGNEATTGALLGTTGSDNAFTFSAHTDGKIYLENRRGAMGDIEIVLEAF